MKTNTTPSVVTTSTPTVVSGFTLGLDLGERKRIHRTGRRIENHFVREERRPFKGVSAVGVGAADKFVLAVGLANQFGVAELADNLAAVALGDDVFQFHILPS